MEPSKGLVGAKLGQVGPSCGQVRMQVGLQVEFSGTPSVLPVDGRTYCKMRAMFNKNWPDVLPVAAEHD